MFATQDNDNHEDQVRDAQLRAERDARRDDGWAAANAGSQWTFQGPDYYAVDPDETV